MQLDAGVKAELEERFNFVSILGQGSFGCVYECEDKRDGEIYAVKIIVKGNVKKSKMECLREEARLLSSISHPNIVKVYEFVETDTFIFLRMEIIRNGTLEKLINKRWESGSGFSDDEMAAIMGSIFRALNYIHSIHIIHRDIKPENILVPHDSDLSNLKMADFGLSTKLDFFYPKTATSKCGTMLYMAPEILNNLTYSKLVDIWSCSIILFLLAKGVHPFYEPKMTTEAYKTKIKDVTFPPLPNALAQDFEARISKIDPNERYTTLEALKHPWLTRKFDDQIPQSLHESVKGFEKSHCISNMFKLLITAKHILNPSGKSHIPQSYKLKKSKVSDECLLLNIKRLPNKRFDKESQSSPNLRKVEPEPKQKENIAEKKYEPDTPAILKLNKIFDTLLERKPRKKEKFYTEVAQQPKDILEPLPKTLPFKEKLENEIERFVREFKSEEDTNRGNVGRRMLPENKRKECEKYLGDKEELRSSGESMGSFTSFKIRQRKKHNQIIRLYD